MNVIVDTGVAALDLLATPVVLTSYRDMLLDYADLAKQRDKGVLQAFLAKALETNRALVAAAPPPLYDVITESLLTECDTLRNVTFGEHFHWGATIGSKDCTKYKEVFTEYVKGLLKIFKLHAVQVKAASGVNPAFKIIADDFENKICWIFQGFLLDNRCLALHTRLPLLTPNLIANLTDILYAQEDGWNEVSIKHCHTFI